MVSILSLWLPILLSAVLAFVASSVIHMLLPLHKNDFRKIPNEDGALDALRPLSIPAGDYMFPYCASAEAMKSEAYRSKVESGPVGVMTVFGPATVFNMGPQLVQWFVYCLFVGVVAAYVTGRSLTAGTDYLEVFRLAGTVSFACYAMSLPQRSIWYKQSWGSTLRSMLDGLVYGCLAGGAFGWLWP